MHCGRRDGLAMGPVSTSSMLIALRVVIRAFWRTVSLQARGVRPISAISVGSVGSIAGNPLFGERANPCILVVALVSHRSLAKLIEFF